MLKTNVHVHVFTADHTAEIQFFYLLWDFFYKKLVRDGIELGPVTLRFQLETIARYRWWFRLLLRVVARLEFLAKMLDEPLNGLVRTIYTVTHASVAQIHRILGLSKDSKGRHFLRELLVRLDACKARGERYPFDAALAGITWDLFALHRQRTGGEENEVSQESLLRAFFAANQGKANFSRIVLLTVNFDAAFRGIEKHGLKVTPDIPFEQQARDAVALVELGRRFEPPVTILPFFGIDPRCMPHDDPLGWLAQWVGPDKPFKGLKVYPPMGFYPHELMRVFEWCKDHSIPVTAHCSMGGAGIRGLEKATDYAHPQNWHPVLDALIKRAGPGVFRLNLAHFSDLNRCLDREATKTWSDEIIATMMKYNDSGCVEVYSDIAYTIVSESEWPAFERNLAVLKAGGLDKWVLFGCDWWNFLPDCPDEAAYLQQLHMTQTGPFDAKLLEQNADRFLGMSCNT